MNLNSGLSQLSQFCKFHQFGKKGNCLNFEQKSYTRYKIINLKAQLLIF